MVLTPQDQERIDKAWLELQTWIFKHWYYKPDNGVSYHTFPGIKACIYISDITGDKLIQAMINNLSDAMQFEISDGKANIFPLSIKEKVLKSMISRITFGSLNCFHIECSVKLDEISMVLNIAVIEAPNHLVDLRIDWSPTDVFFNSPDVKSTFTTIISWFITWQKQVSADYLLLSPSRGHSPRSDKETWVQI
jgi:hypothetical protein